ncbi:MAG: hypothetical protein IMZ52_08095 [Actinobacteria bacterium]|nr:hypothetical protein [Actinomycetota bacterium]MBE3114624.1 hypothetical protein [Actinomycetota bacterium]
MNISVILPTYRRNCQEELNNLHNYDKYMSTNQFGEEFKQLYDKYVKDAIHILNPTIWCLLYQTFKDFEIVLCHKYPEDLDNLVRDYIIPKSKDEINLGSVISYKGKIGKVIGIKEKDSIWHKLGDYATVNNNRNTGIINAIGELLFFLDDMTIFNENLLQTVWDNYKDGYYTTCKAIKRIKIIDDKIIGTEKMKGNEGNDIPNTATWTYGMSVSMKECLKIGGMDEIWDGSFGGTDTDFGRRLAQVSRYKRKLGPTIYEFSHYAEQKKRKKTRDDEIFRQICRQSPVPKHIVANSWKPTDSERLIYKKWHESTIGELDKNWDKFMDVELFDMKKERSKLNG